jgi:diguanylate cyclase (GGDEF)-like protein
VHAPRWTYVAMLVVLTAYVGALLVPGGVPPVLRDDVLGCLVFVPPLVLLVQKGAERPDHRVWTLTLAVGVALYLCGNVLYFFNTGLGGRAFPSVADVGYLGIYPFLLAGLLLALREHLRGVRLIVALDGLAGLLAGGAVTCWVIKPLIEHVWDGSLRSATLLAYPVCAVVVMAACCGALGVVGRSRGRHFLLWVMGMLVFGCGDVMYAYRLAYHDYHVGTWLDASWAVGVAMLATGATQLRPAERRAIPSPRSFLVTSVAAAATVLVLAAAPPWQVDPLPTLLALLALAACTVRFALVFLQVRELAAVRQQAHTDELTGAANRRGLYTALDERLQRDDSFGLMLIDLDHFKEVNDSFGHAAGDALLKAVVARFTKALDDLETPHLLARLGGDEFAVVLHEVGFRDAAEACAGALQESLQAPVELDEVVLHVQASIGIALAPEHATTRADMLFAADAAMYAAKTAGEPISYFSPDAGGDRRKRLEIAEDLYKALDNDELTVEYQPIMTADGKLEGAEALVRWDHPTKGRLSPADFLEVAERYRLTPAIAARVLDVALTDLHRWRSDGAPVRVSVNVSASDLRDEKLVDIVASALLKQGIPPSALTVEITETAMMRDPETASAVMHALDDLGVRLAIDDYGTGYSSLEYLLKLPINELKLDRAFSKHLIHELRSVAIVRSTIDLTHALGLRMVAEGVEDQNTLEILQELECDLVQGWHLGRPMPALDFEALLASVESQKEAGRRPRAHN